MNQHNLNIKIDNQNLIDRKTVLLRNTDYLTDLNKDTMNTQKNNHYNSGTNSQNDITLSDHEYPSINNLNNPKLNQEVKVTISKYKDEPKKN